MANSSASSTSNKARIAVAGASGRMGRAIIRAIVEIGDCRLTGALVSKQSVEFGKDAGELAGRGKAGVPLTCDAGEALRNADVLIDVSTPAASVALAGRAAAAGVQQVIGTTGFSSEQEELIQAAARRTAIVKSGNMSIGVTLLACLVRQAARALPGFDIEIFEMHHRMKADAPSGTALLLGRAAAEGRGKNFENLAMNVGQARTEARVEGSIGFASLRGGTVVGEHEVIFAGPCERIALSHSAEDRSIFARGALVAARWVRGKPPGLYTMQDVLSLKV